ncbi:hypothetical protein [Mycobacteroides abscessus]|uniref:hypothetical protein n=1 Tax=Mycobacteroides abscessus TaxID=36809 RepID=UPI000C264FA2|nr:hypothetical protein [Mycobacteroides abscessus]
MARTIFVTPSSNGRLWEAAHQYGESTKDSADDTPSAIAYSGNGYIFFRRASDDKLRCLVVDKVPGKVNTFDIKAPDDTGLASADAGPAAVIDGSNIRLFYHRGGIVYYRLLTSTSVGKEQKFCSLISGGIGQPVVTQYAGGFYVFLRTTDTGGNPKGVVCYNTDGKTASIHTTFLPNGIRTKWRVSACLYQEDIVLASYDEGSSTTILERYDGENWSPPNKTADRPNWREIGGPGVIAYRGLLYIFYVAQGYPIRYRTYDGNAFSTEQAIAYTDQQASNHISPYCLDKSLFLCYLQA